MNEAIFIAASGGKKEMRKMDITSNNLANVNNSGFKKDSLVFESLIPPLEPDLSFDASRNALLPPELGNADVTYVTVSEMMTDHSKGFFVKTDNELDVALQGEGYLTVETPYGIRYTRKGNLGIDTQGRLVTQNGFPLLDDGDQPIVIQSNSQDITIDPDGNISLGTGSGNTPIAQLQLVDFKDKHKLIKEGDGLFKWSDEDIPPDPAQNMSLRQGFLENSNVNVVEEMGQMVTALRAFEAYQQVIQTVDRLNNQSVNTLGRLI